MLRLASRIRSTCLAPLIVAVTCLCLLGAPARAGAELLVTTGFKNPVSVGVSPDGRTVFVLQMQGWVALRRDLNTGELRHIGGVTPNDEKAGTQLHRSFAFSPDGRDVYFTTFDKPTVIRRVDVSGARAVEVAPIPLPETWHAYPDRTFLQHPDGIHLLVERVGERAGADLASSTIVFRRRADGGLDIESEHATRWGSLNQFSADGRMLLSWYGWRSYPATGADWTATPYAWGFDMVSNGMDTISPSGRLGIAAGHLTRLQDGTWASVTTVPRDLDPMQVATGKVFTTDDRFLYSSSNLSSQGFADVALQAYRIDEPTSALTRVQQRLVTENCTDTTRSCHPSRYGEHLNRPKGLVLSPDGQHAYALDVTNRFDQAGINHYDRDVDTGLLSFHSWTDNVTLDTPVPTIDTATIRTTAGMHTVTVGVSGELAGIDMAQLATDTSAPGAWMQYAPRLRRTGSRPPAFVRVRDGAGRTTAWRLLPAPRIHATLVIDGVARRGCATAARPCVAARAASMLLRTRPLAHAAFLDGSQLQATLERRTARGWALSWRGAASMDGATTSLAVRRPARVGTYRIRTRIRADSGHSASAPITRYVLIT